MSKRRRDGSMSTSLDHTRTWAFPGAENHNTPAAGSGPTRKRTTACAACRKQKMKCEMTGNEPPCTRCARRGISCMLDKSLQALLQDQKQNEVLQRDIQNMHAVLQRLCRELNVDPPIPLASLAESQALAENTHILHGDADEDDGNEDSSQPTTPSTVQAPIDTFMKVGGPNRSSTGGFSQSPRERRTAQPQQVKDLVSQGLISLGSAEMLVERYFSRLDRSLYGIASQYKDLHAIRQASPILLAAICTVSALHDSEDQNLYEICNREFRRLVSTSLFEKRDVEYLRALCIGSFWLADTSRILTSDAVRRAADVRLHRYFYQVINAKRNGATPVEYTVSQEEARDRIRLWYITFICDQHFSILHNRDGLLRHDKKVLEMWDLYLTSDGGNETDTRLMSQVSILLISTAVRDAFGPDESDQVNKSFVVQLNHFSRQLDDWFLRISALYNSDARIGDFPKAGIQMHLQFGKLYLGHHVFRGLKTDPIPVHFLPAANMARDAAVSIFETILNDEKLRESLFGRPHYVFIMISFAGHFLLEICKKCSEQLSINFDSTFQLISNVLTVFANIPLIPQHPISRMTTGLRRKLIDCASSLGKLSAVNENLGLSSETDYILPNAAYPAGSTALPANNISITAPFFFPMDRMPLDIDQFFYTEYGEFNFPDMTMNFLN